LVAPPTRTEARRRSRELRLATFRPVGGLHQPEERTTAPERIPAVRQAARQRGERLLSGERVSSRGGGSEARTPIAPPAAKSNSASMDRCPVRSLTSFHSDPRYGGDLHRADMAWAVHAAARGLHQEHIEHEILNSRDLSKKDSPPLVKRFTRLPSRVKVWVETRVSKRRRASRF